MFCDFCFKYFASRINIRTQTTSRIRKTKIKTQAWRWLTEDPLARPSRLHHLWVAESLLQSSQGSLFTSPCGHLPIISSPVQQIGSRKKEALERPIPVRALFPLFLLRTKSPPTLLILSTVNDPLCQAY